MPIDQLLAMRVFVRIAESGSFARTADSLDLPRSTASKLLRDLETHLGSRLLQRTTRTVSVTAEGAAYYERATRLLGEIEEMDADAARSGAQLRGRLRIDIGSSLANLILVPALPDFRARYPQIELLLGVGDRTVDLVGEGVDCAIRGGPLESNSLIARRLGELEFVTCASPDYLEARGTPRQPRDLESGHVAVSYFSALTARPLPLLFRRGEETVEIMSEPVVAVNESNAHIAALLAGLGVGQTFRFAVQGHVGRGALTPVLGGWSRPSHPVHLVYPPNRHLNARVRVFVDWVAEVFRAALGPRAAKGKAGALAR